MAGVYVHVPFCQRKCHYCGFISRPAASSLEKEDYVAALKKEVLLREGELRDTGFESLYIGGGTPTVLEGDTLAGLIEWLLGRLPFPATAEVTVEVNPRTVDPGYLSRLRGAGVNRLSIGAQSFEDRLLHKIGRTHLAADTVLTIDQARRAGFENISLDLIYGLPGQDEPGWSKSLAEAVSLRPEHISAYSLQVEDGTPLADMIVGGSMTVPGEDEVVGMMDCLESIMEEEGYRQYEVSNFARDGFESRHNLLYWTGGEYLGFGVAAHSFRGKERRFNVNGIEEYFKALKEGRLPIAGLEKLGETTLRFEAVMTGLRLVRGIEKEGFFRRFGMSLEEAYPGVLAELVERGYLADEGGFIRVTPRGRRILNRVILEFL